ncbi:hypothetical protein OESDEN_02617 [Oesophagostomum dentatum]|uniref:G-protein coupled receptors family 1 profile domain-containing protein n=1 Tax=Oesophagostomum dentatum TaxID=61180 RepID=A0A0B1TNJ2_OESDE|nr:hypothetical protein OESDEN_02617 [Oesophagostomum dentatum]
MTAAMHGQVKQVFVNGAAVFVTLLLACYVVFLIKIRKTEIRDKNLRSIYRSLILISLTVVFGWFATSGIATAASAQHIDINDVRLTLFAGLFLNLSISSNFFIYYIVSEQYRESFDRYLHIGVLRKIARKQRPVSTLPLPSTATTMSRRNFA